MGTNYKCTIPPIDPNYGALFLHLIPNVVMFTPTDARKISTSAGHSPAPLKYEGQ